MNSTALESATAVLLKNLDTEIDAIAQTDSGRPTDSRRWFHGRGQLVPELAFMCIDFFDPVIHITLFDEPPGTREGSLSSAWLNEFVSALIAGIEGRAANAGIVAINVQQRHLPGAPSYLAWGALPDSLYARRDGQRFVLKLDGRQNSGFFLDMEPGRQWLESVAAGRTVLNLFSYTCAFSLVAIKAGAERVVNVDMASGALNQGRDNHRLNELPKEKSVFMCENILKSWSRIRRRGPYDVVILDPPSFQKGSFVANKDYARIVRRLPELMPAGGKVLACLNAPQLGEDFLKDLFDQELPGNQFLERLIPSPDFPDKDSARQLKLLVFEFNRP